MSKTERLTPDKFKHEAPVHAYADVLGGPDLSGLIDAGRLLETGVVLGNEAQRAGTFIQADHSLVHAAVSQEGLEVLSTDQARQQYDWVDKEYRWKMVPPDADEYTRHAHEHARHGYFIRALPGSKSTYPLQACLYIAQEGLAQAVHNIIIVEEGAELNIITGCVSSKEVKHGMHIGISEFYIKKNAKLTFTMIHNWAEKMHIFPRSAARIEEGGTFLQNYVCLVPVAYLQMNPALYLSGRGALVRSNTILVGTPGSFMDVGSRVFLQAPEAKAEVIARTVTTGGDVINRGRLVGEVSGVKAHLECHGLLLTPKGLIHAIPELEARVEGAEMSHEAAVGKIAPEEIEYLMARGLDEDEARSTIVRGFLNVRMEGLPPELQARIDHAVSQSQESLR